MRLKHYKKKTIWTYLGREISLMVLGIIFSFIIVDKLSNRFNEVIMPIIDMQAKKHISTIINDATDNIKFDSNLFTIEKNTMNEIKRITYDSYEATKLINEITHNIQDKLDNVSENGKKELIIMEIPMGVVFKNSLFRNFGPKIKIKSDLIGSLLSELETEVKPYGINNALIEVKVKISANMQVVMPLGSKEIQVVNMIPISINIVNGKVPEGYIYSYK